MTQEGVVFHFFHLLICVIKQPLSRILLNINIMFNVEMPELLNVFNILTFETFKWA